MLLAALAWALGVGSLIDASPFSMLLLAALVLAAAFGIGYEMERADAALLVFGVVALGGVLLTATGLAAGFEGAGLGVLLMTAPALMAIPAAYAGGRLREQRRRTRH